MHGRHDLQHKIRFAERSEIGALARLWYDGWQGAHAHILPVELARLRTLESFEERLQARLADVRAIGPVGTPLGFCMLKGDELYQLYVSNQARGTGVAKMLIAGPVVIQVETLNGPFPLEVCRYEKRLESAG